MRFSAISPKRRTISLLLKCIVFVSATVGTYLSFVGGTGGFMLGSTSLMYFTIQSNIAIALIGAVGAVLMLKKADVSNAWFIIKYVGTVAITLTGGVFCFMLAPTLGDRAWNIQNVLTHIVVPVAAIADFFLVGAYGDLQTKHVPFVAIPPILYLIFGVIAYIEGWKFADGNNYPYFFMNWGSPAGAFGFIGEFPFMGCVWWMLALAVIVLAVGFLYVLILNRIKRRKNNRTIHNGHSAPVK